MILASIVVLLLPKRYDSDAKLFVRLGRGSVSLDPAATTGSTIALQESRETEINSVVDMLQSRGVAEEVVKQIGPERILKKYSWIERQLEWVGGIVPELSSGSVGNDIDPDAPVMTEEEVEDRKRLELAVKDLQENIQIKSPRKSTTISITFRGRDPFLAQKVTTTLIDTYKQLHIKAYKADGSFAFFQQKYDEQSKILQESQDELRYAKDEMMIITMQGKQDSLQQQITENQKMQLDVRAELVAAKARVSELQRDMLSLPTEVLQRLHRVLPMRERNRCELCFTNWRSKSRTWRPSIQMNILRCKKYACNWLAHEKLTKSNRKNATKRL